MARGTITVTPPSDWNRLGSVAGPGKNAELWTLDGPSLNDITFYGGIADDKTLFREVDRRDRPLPRFSATMLAPDVAGLLESSYRIAIGTPLFQLGRIEPATFAGQSGFRFTYSYTIQDEEVRRDGEATGAIVGGKLYLVTYEAPVLHYFDKSVADYRAIVASARLGG